MENQFKKYITKTISPSQSLSFLLLGSYQRLLYDMDAAIKQSTAEDEAYQQSVVWLSRTSSNLVFTCKITFQKTVPAWFMLFLTR